MKIDWAFLKLVFFCYAGALILVVLPFFLLASREIAQSVFASSILSLVHLLAGYVIIEFGFDKPNTIFLKIILGGTALRLLVVVATVFVLIRAFQFHTMSLMLSMLLYYVLNLVLEVHILQKKVELKG